MPTSGTPSSAAPPADPAYFRGTLSTRWEHRREGNDHADDLLIGLGLDGGDAERDPYTFHLDGRVRKGLHPGHRDKEFAGLNDTYDAAGEWTLYDAYVDVHGDPLGGDPPLDKLRIGRQTDVETPVPVAFDGVHVATAPEGRRSSRIGVYGGLAYHVYESGSRRDDELAGVYTEWRPWRGGRLRLDWLHTEDERTVGSFHDDLLGAHLWQDLRPVRFDAAWTSLEGESRDLRLVASLPDAEHGLLVRASWYELYATQETQALEVDPLSSSLFDLFPFHEQELSVSKSFEDDLTVLAGLARRRVDDADDEGTYNRDVDRNYVTTTLHEFLGEANSLSLTGTQWKADSGDHTTWGADLTRELSSKTEATVGTSYVLYQTDPLTGTERQDVRVYHARLEHELAAGSTLDLGLDFEHSDLGSFQTLNARWTWRF